VSEDTFDSFMSWYTGILIRLEIEKNALFYCTNKILNILKQSIEFKSLSRDT